MTELTMTRTPHLAVLGATPRFEEPLHVGRPNVPADLSGFHKRLDDILTRRWLTNDGGQVREFQERVCSLLSVKHCVAMCNGTVALEIASRALGFSGEVIVPAFTFVASAHALRWQGVMPAFCDIEPQWHHLDPKGIADRGCARTSGVLAVHLWGRACAVEEIEAEAAALDVPVLFDASHAFGCSHRGRMIGNFGAAETFSFHATKFINTFEGGAVVTNDSELAERMRFMRNFGFCGEDRVSHVGTNGKMNEPAAAFGLSLLDELDYLIDHNKSNYEAYIEGLAEVPGIRVLPFAGVEKANFQHIVAEVDEAEMGLLAMSLYRCSGRKGCLRDATSIRAVIAWSVSTEQPQRRRPSTTDRIAQRVLVLPTGTALAPSDALSICRVLEAAHGMADQVRAALA